MSFLIDGYNFLFRIEGLRKGSLEQQRRHFIEVLDRELACFRASVFVIFDSAQQSRPFAQCVHCSHLDVLYAPKGQSADHYILELIEISKSPKLLTVISSDSGLVRQCRALGANTLSVEDFLILIARKGRKRVCRPMPIQDAPREIERLLREFERRLRDLGF